MFFIYNSDWTLQNNSSILTFIFLLYIDAIYMRRQLEIIGNQSRCEYILRSSRSIDSMSEDLFRYAEDIKMTFKVPKSK